VARKGLYSLRLASPANHSASTQRALCIPAVSKWERGVKLRIKRFNCVLLSILVIASIVALALPLLSPSPMHALPRQHAPIVINGNSGFTSPNPVNGGGSGTRVNPYIIENWVISASSANGIDIQNTTAYFIVRNCLIENGGSSHVGIYLNTVINGKIENNICDNCHHGIDLGSNSNYIVIDNNIGAGSCGIHLWHSSYDNVINNHCYNTYGRADNVVAAGLDTYNGIGLYFTYYCTIENNLCENGSHAGIKVGDSSAYDNVINNVCDNCKNGVYISDEGHVCYNLVSHNTCYYCKYGICIDASTDNYNTLDNNTCENNSYGIYIDTLSNSNSLYHNQITNNTNQAYDAGSNHWDNGSAGNYWSDYTGSDANGDGVGDTPYNIPGRTNQDNYPLMSLFSPAWGGSVKNWKLENLYVVGLEKDLWLYQGSRLVAVFYTYGGIYRDNTVIENFTPPVHTAENEKVSRPGKGAIQRVELVLVDNSGNTISTIARFVSSRTIIVGRIGQISALWPFASEARKATYAAELGSIGGLWPFSPET